MTELTVIAFDADDTLWHNERYFRMTQDHFTGLLADYAGGGDIEARLLEAERRNIRHYGYGIKGFVLSMIETALDVTGDRVPAPIIREIVMTGQEMLRHPIDLLPHVRETLEALRADYRVMLITKGDLLDQERKLAQSGLGEAFDAVEIVSDKTPDAYRRIFDRLGHRAERAMMVGDSLKSDVLPVIELGGWGVHVPGAPGWALEAAEPPTGAPRFRKIRDLKDLPVLVAGIANRTSTT